MLRIRFLNLICLCAVFLFKLRTCEADDDRFIFRDDNSLNSSSNQESTVEKDDPCAPYNKTTPNFSRPGTRISTAKCYEYIWQMKNRFDVTNRQRECEEYERIKKGEEINPVMQIVGGSYTLRGEFPNMGAIGWKAVLDTWIFMCGSSLISPKFVLTAGHCSTASSRDTTIADVVPKIVRLGERSIDDSSYTNGQKPHDARIIRIIVHPKYRPPKKYFDIALMELGREVKFSSDIQPTCLWSGGDVLNHGSQAEIAGWGVVRSGSPNMSTKLLAASVDLVSFEECDKLLRPNCNRNWCGLRDHQLCAGKLSGGVDSCQGDSGGPLQVKISLPIIGQGSMHYLLGVTSFGIGCGLPNMPGVYTKVSSFIDWIERNVWK